MKLNIKSKVKSQGLVCKLSWRLFILSLCFVCFLQTVDAQELTKVYTDKLTVANGIDIHSYGTSFSLECHGTVGMKTLNQVTHISDDTREPRFIVSRLASFKTHAQNQVTYQTIVKVEGPDAQKLLDAMNFDLRESATGVVKISHMLNVSKFYMTNGWMRADENAVVLDSGISYDISRFEIQTEVTIPQSSNLILEGSETHFEIGKLDGKISATLDGGTLECESVNEIEARLDECAVNITKLNHGDLSLRISKLNIRSANRLKLEGELSQINITNVDSLNISKTYNDKFQIKEVKYLKCFNSVFSNYKIEKLHTSLNMKIVNGDLSIKEIQANFKKIRLNNEVSTIRLGVEGLENYSLRSPNVTKTEFTGLDNENFKQGQSGYKGDPKLGGEIILSCENCKVIFEDW